MKDKQETTSDSSAARESHIARILGLFDRLYRETHRVSHGSRGEWLTLDLTMPQIKTLLLLFTDGILRTSDLASALDVSLPTMTGIIDRLEEKGMAVRESDPQDRRVVLCKLSEMGRQLMGGIWQTGMERVKELLGAMTSAELELVEGGTRAFLNSLSTVRPDSTIKEPHTKEK
jgi:DNA-binding MarR family transcriptional regulator